MPKVRDEVIEYRSHHHGQKGRCRVRVYTAARATRIMLATELKDNPGPSVTNAIEFIAQQVTSGDAHGWRFVEHYPERGSASTRRNPETFDIVEFAGLVDPGPEADGPETIGLRHQPAFTGPVWRHIGLAEFESLIHEKWEGESWKP